MTMSLVTATILIVVVTIIVDVIIKIVTKKNLICRRYINNSSVEATK